MFVLPNRIAGPQRTVSTRGSSDLRRRNGQSAGMAAGNDRTMGLRGRLFGLA